MSGDSPNGVKTTNGVNGLTTPSAQGSAPTTTETESDGSVDDLATEGGDDAGDESPLEPPPPAVAELVAACLRFTASKYGVALDGTPDTLSILDQYVRDARDTIRSQPESLDLVTGAVGAYLGEVVRQALGGYWFAEGDLEGWRLDMARVYLTFNPIGMAREALLSEATEGWHAHLEMDLEDREEVDARLAALGEMDEGDYFLPSTRYDVVELVVAALHARMVSRGLGDVVMTPDDYRKK
ncbi:MAG: DUF6278 family protein [Polyangiaceae bacterium]